MSEVQPKACARCGGLAVWEVFADLREELSRASFLGTRCLNCGHIDDPVILARRPSLRRSVPRALDTTLGRGAPVETGAQAGS